MRVVYNVIIICLVSDEFLLPFKSKSMRKKISRTLSYKHKFSDVAFRPSKNGNIEAKKLVFVLILEC